MWKRLKQVHYYLFQKSKPKFLGRCLEECIFKNLMFSFWIYSRNTVLSSSVGCLQANSNLEEPTKKASLQCEHHQI